jgi:hypothetical protein
MNNRLNTRRVAILAAALLSLAATSASRLSGESVADLVIQVGNALTGLPSTIDTNLKSLSLDKLDPTCPQCL